MPYINGKTIFILIAAIVYLATLYFFTGGFRRPGPSEASKATFSDTFSRERIHDIEDAILKEFNGSLPSYSSSSRSYPTLNKVEKFKPNSANRFDQSKENSNTDTIEDSPTRTVYIESVETKTLTVTTQPTFDYARENPPTPRANAAIVILCRNSELEPIRRTLREFEDRFNRRYRYPYVFLNDVPFTDEFRDTVTNHTSSEISFGLIPKEHWSVPDSIENEVLESSLRQMERNQILYGGLLSYHHMCRFNSGFFFQHPLLSSYDWYWRLEPGVHFYCDILYDPFLFMEQNNKQYGFVIALEEIPQTIPTLWEHTMRFAIQQNITSDFMHFFSDDSVSYNLCHFWSNFEIASLNLWRSPEYMAYFEYLDKTGNFFYERWGDAPVHSLAAGLFLQRDQVHFFEDIGYQHDDFMHCPDTSKASNYAHCLCPENKENFDTNSSSCLSRWSTYQPKDWTISDSKAALAYTQKSMRRKSSETAWEARRREYYRLFGQDI